MRITRAMLLKIADDTVKERVARENGLLAAYLCGSLLEGGEPLLGGTADIDLVFIYESREIEREIVRMTDEVHLDILHHPRTVYEPGRKLREENWLGHTVYNCKPMHDPDHFFDFVQAGARSMFDLPENIRARIEPLFQSARSSWMMMNGMGNEPGAHQVGTYLEALANIAQGIAGVTGTPLPERRFMLGLPARAEAIGETGLDIALGALFGAGQVEAEQIRDWMPFWMDTIMALSDQGSGRLHVNRRFYYQRAVDALLTEGHLPAALWPMLRTWTDAVGLLDTSTPQGAVWYEAMEQLDLCGADAFAQRLEALDALLDRIEEWFDDWKTGGGLEI